MSTDKIYISDFDVADYLDSDEMIIEYLKISLEDGQDSFLMALSAVARAKGMQELSRKTGITREGIYKALKVGAKPRYETIQKILQGLNIKLEPVMC